ncbi:MAG: hypothetical protein ACR2P3_00395 [Geminicoccaceae bacterium]
MVSVAPRAGRLSLVVIALASSTLTACQQYWRESGVWDIGEHQGLLLDVSNYYHRHATEEGGQCRSPILEGVSQAAVGDLDDGVFDVHIHYRYRDFLKDGDDCDRRLRPLRCTINRECYGFAARDFRVAKAGTGFDVIDMSGGRRR